ncbi:MAG: sarcosine oxidase subunit gamma [Cypionkella sp.]
MPNLIAKSALFGKAPVTLAGTTLEEATLGQITSIACFPGTVAEVAARLGSFPAPNRVSENLIWTGPEQAFLLGQPAPDLSDIAAVTDQSGGWAALRLTGPKAADTLMRLYPLDLRASQFPPGTCARAPLGHMQSVLIREADSFLILIFRSMARTAWHEVESALQALDARAQAGV